MRKSKLIGKILGIALVFVMIGSMLGGLAGVTNVSSAQELNNPNAVPDSDTSRSVTITYPSIITPSPELAPKTLEGGYITREKMMEIAEAYKTHEWTPTEEENKFHKICPKCGKPINTPDRDYHKAWEKWKGWKFKEKNMGVPYQWGGFSSISGLGLISEEDFDNQFKGEGTFTFVHNAGDIDTTCGEWGCECRHACGVDCSGFVARCWNLPWHPGDPHPRLGEFELSWPIKFENLRRGDILIGPGHVILFKEFVTAEKTTQSKTKIRVYEASGKDGKVSEWEYSLKSIKAKEEKHGGIKYKTNEVTLEVVGRINPEDGTLNTTILSGYCDGINYIPRTYNPIRWGLMWLRTTQNPDGSWGSNVGYTSLAALAFLNHGVDESDPTVSKAINYILSKKHLDGSIYTWYSNYETSLAILPLVATHNSDYDDEIAAAKNYLVSIQNDESAGIDNTSAWYGGWAYSGLSSGWSDLSNTQWTMMGLDAANLPKTNSTWTKAEIFVTRCQNLEATNPTYKYSNDGGFGYQPPTVACCGRHISYGSMTTAGIWGLKLAGVPTSDQRVQAGLNWLRDNYAPIETEGNTQNPYNPSWYLYYHLLGFSKALVMTGIPAGSWQETASQDITSYIVSQQHDDGHWTSSNEWDIYATEQAILALETRTIPTDIKRLSYLTFILHSNADLHVYDPLGRHVGMNYDTGEIEIQIPNATYSVDPQNITIPELIPGNYRIVLVGTGTGEYTLDVTGGVGDEIVSENSFTSTISEGEVHDANVNVAMITWLTIHVDDPEPTDAMVQSATGTGNVSFVADSGTIEDLTALNESDLPEENTAIDFPHGLFIFNITGLSDGETVNVTIDFPQNISTTAQYWKYHTPEGWYQIPMGSNDGDNIITIQLTDGGLGDDDGIANGVIVDQGGPGVSAMILATVDFDPDTLNKKSEGKWVTVYTELPEGYGVTDIDVSTLMLNETVPAELHPTEIGDYDSDGIADLMVKFDRDAVVDILPIGDAVNVTVTGKLYDGTPFEGCDAIRVIDQG